MASGPKGLLRDKEGGQGKRTRTVLRVVFYRGPVSLGLFPIITSIWGRTQRTDVTTPTFDQSAPWVSLQGDGVLGNSKQVFNCDRQHLL
ncbi:hypothetical protein V2G26_014284 [Clonostachys chloroleuca]